MNELKPSEFVNRKSAFEIQLSLVFLINECRTTCPVNAGTKAEFRRVNVLDIDMANFKGFIFQIELNHQITKSTNQQMPYHQMITQIFYLRPDARN